ncbi:BT_3044 domain-containing protein, partial [Allofournierella sp.]|uniref:BT_3044 domain-containing protein n=1 Tax=Allofournierella sp. TaxID=1940256 RepID=UPI003AB218CA
YVTNKRKGWRKALLHVLPYNDYSGNYSATAMNIYFSMRPAMGHFNAKTVCFALTAAGKR